MNSFMKWTMACSLETNSMALNKLLEKVNEHEVSFPFQVLIVNVKFLIFK